jgi:hypothetical protein
MQVIRPLVMVVAMEWNPLPGAIFDDALQQRRGV